MLAFVDASLILLLGGTAVFAVPLLALPSAAWIALTTPILVWTDLRERRLPNVVTLPALAVVVTSAAVGLSQPSSRGESLVALFVVAGSVVVGTALSSSGALGLGDVKLAAALVGSLLLAATWLVFVFALVASASALGLALAAIRLDRSATKRRCCATAGKHSCGLWDGPGEWVSGGETPQARPGVAFGPCLLLGYWVALGLAIFDRLTM